MIEKTLLKIAIFIRPRFSVKPLFSEVQANKYYTSGYIKLILKCEKFDELGPFY